MITDIEKIDYGEFHAAEQRWYTYWFDKNISMDRGKHLMVYLGVTTFRQDVHTGTIYLHQEAARKLRLLLTPHYATIITAWSIRHMEVK